MKVPLRRVVLIGENIELRIVSLVVRCREVAEDVVLFDTGSTDETAQLAEEVDTQVVHYEGALTPQNLGVTGMCSGELKSTATFAQRRIDLVFANHFHVEIVGLAAQREQGSGRLGHPLSLPGISLG